MKQEIINQFYLELSKIATVKTQRELELEDLLVSARCIAQRQGAETAWERFDSRIAAMGISRVSPKPFKILPSDQ